MVNSRFIFALQAIACGLALVFTSCQKEMPQEAPEKEIETIDGVPFRCCATEGVDATKTQLAYNSSDSKFHVQWITGDKIHIIGDGKEAEYSVWTWDDNLSHANLSWSKGDKLTNKAVYRAVYPSYYGTSSGELTTTSAKTVLNAYQRYAVLTTDGSTPTIADDVMPMVGISGSDGSLISFKNVAAVLKVMPNCTEANLTLKRLVLTCSSQIAGDVVINTSNMSNPTITSASSYTVTVENPDGVAAGSAKALAFNKAVYFVIRPGTYTDATLTATYSVNGGADKTQDIIIEKITAERNKVVEITADFMTTMLPFVVHADEIEDLSASGTANCYLINKADPSVDGETGYTYTEYYKFDSKYRGNQVTTDGGLAAWIPAENRTHVHNYFSTGLSTKTFEIGPVLNSADGYIYFKIPRLYRTDTSKPLNANGNHEYSVFGSELIAVNSSKTLEGSDIAWSWHIWVCPNAGNRGSTVKDVTMTLSGTSYNYLRVGLGAYQAQYNSTISSPRGQGFFYQWGRKDPLNGQHSRYLTDPWSAEAGKVSVAESVKHPLIQYLGSGEDSDWCSTNSANLWVSSGGKKTMFDPCPPGYHATTKAELDLLVGQPVHGASGSSQGAGTGSGWNFNCPGSGYRYDGVINSPQGDSTNPDRASYLMSSTQSDTGKGWWLVAKTAATGSVATYPMTTESTGKACAALVRCVADHN